MVCMCACAFFFVRAWVSVKGLEIDTIRNVCLFLFLSYINFVLLKTIYLFFQNNKKCGATQFRETYPSTYYSSTNKIISILSFLLKCLQQSKHRHQKQTRYFINSFGNSIMWFPWCISRREFPRTWGFYSVAPTLSCFKGRYIIQDFRMHRMFHKISACSFRMNAVR